MSVIAIPVQQTNADIIITLHGEYPQPVVNEHGGTDLQFLIIQPRKNTKIMTREEMYKEFGQENLNQTRRQFYFG